MFEILSPVTDELRHEKCERQRPKRRSGRALGTHAVSGLRFFPITRQAGAIAFGVRFFSPGRRGIAVGSTLLLGRELIFFRDAFESGRRSFLALAAGLLGRHKIIAVVW